MYNLGCFVYYNILDLSIMAKNKKHINIEDLDNRFDELSSMIARGFENTATKDEMNSRFNQVDQ